MNRVINEWNSLATFVVESSSINTFKSLLDNYFLDLLLYNALIGYTGLPLPVFNHNHNQKCQPCVATKRTIEFVNKIV